jgi:hypothetical protein
VGDVSIRLSVWGLSNPDGYPKRKHGAISIIEIGDANQNGFPEIILEMNFPSRLIDVLEWDALNIHKYQYTHGGEMRFRSLWVPNDRHINPEGFFELPVRGVAINLEAMDLDPLLDLAVHIQPPYADDSFYEGYPWRNEVNYYTWNGSSYVFAKKVYDPSFSIRAVHMGTGFYVVHRTTRNSLAGIQRRRFILVY